MLLAMNLMRLRSLWYLPLTILLAFGLLAGCGVSDWVETAEDCLPGEVYDPNDGLCYVEVECDSDEACQEEGDGLADLILGAAGTLLDVAMDPGVDGWEELNEVALITYQVDGDRLYDPQPADGAEDQTAMQDDQAMHQELWAYFAGLIPLSERRMITRYVVFTDGPEETLAMVEPDPEDPTRWTLAIDPADAGDREELTYTLIHEFGHLLTLDERQVPPDLDLAQDPENEDLYQEAAEACPHYFPGEGCSAAESYINAFFERFWIDRYEEWLEIDAEEDEDTRLDLMDQFYQDYQDEFVTDYAATNPEEDIAEAWTLFVLQPKPAGDTIAEEKVLFFYDYPELVKLRAEIAARVYSHLRQTDGATPGE
jgi:hypothetical protein